MIQYNSIIQERFPDYKFFPSIIKPEVVNNEWVLDLPDVRNLKGIVLHCQDNINIAPNGVSPELVKIEDYYFDRNIGEVVVIYWNHNLHKIYDGYLKLVEFPTHSFDFIQSTLTRKSEWIDVSDKEIKKQFMCLNGRPRKHRQMVYNNLVEYEDIGYLSYNDKSNIPNTMMYKDYNFDNVSNFVNLKDIYRSSKLNIVTETLYFESHGIITEKFLQSVLALQVPLLIGYKNIVNDAANFGFDMFDDVVDISYDTACNNTRLYKALEYNEHLIKGEYDYDSLKDRLITNREFLLNNYCDLLIDKFNNSIENF